jgi:hypothetical protein
MQILPDVMGIRMDAEIARLQECFTPRPLYRLPLPALAEATRESIALAAVEARTAGRALSPLLENAVALAGLSPQDRTVGELEALKEALAAEARQIGRDMAALRRTLVDVDA